MRRLHLIAPPNVAQRVRRVAGPGVFRSVQRHELGDGLLGVRQGFLRAVAVEQRQRGAARVWATNQ
jgi:hypothetical protein